MESSSGPKAPGFMPKESGIGSGPGFVAAAVELLMVEEEFSGRVRVQEVGFALAKSRRERAKRYAPKNMRMFRPRLKEERIAKNDNDSSSLQCLFVLI